MRNFDPTRQLLNQTHVFSSLGNYRHLDLQIHFFTVPLDPTRTPFVLHPRKFSETCLCFLFPLLHAIEH